jgi:hypothetical protein
MIEYQYKWILNEDGKTTACVDFVDVERATGVDEFGNDTEYTTKWDIVENRTFIFSPIVTRETLDSLMDSEVLKYV